MVRLDRLWFGAAPAWQRALGLVALGPPSLLFRLGVGVRNALFDAGVLATGRVENVQVVSVGNLVVGGAGKTPLVIFLAQWALASGLRVAVLSRGHGRASRGPLDFDAAALPDEPRCGDEPRLIARKAPGARLYVDADRLRAATVARANGAQVAILDDGFQHRRLARDVDLLVEVPGASPHVLPLGPHREPVANRRRATLCWNGPSPNDPAGALVVERLVDPTGQVATPRRVVALTGIARPDRFLTTLRGLGLDVTGRWHFPDHHRFSPAELARVSSDAARQGAVVVTTEKDRERLPSGFAAVTVETALSVTRGLDTLARALGWPEACAPRPTMEEGAP
ncbi:MAG: tetraacyldisaccharide 4'-kinase [Myxococcaceae bacterium]|nr:tetraacyldisaccharide 4'-kinase [Myxococcaceae bacterium]